MLSLGFIEFLFLRLFKLLILLALKVNPVVFTVDSLLLLEIFLISLGLTVLNLLIVSLICVYLFFKYLYLKNIFPLSIVDLSYFLSK